MRIVWPRRIAGVVTLVLILCVIGILISPDISGLPTLLHGKQIAGKRIGHFAVSARTAVDVQKAAGASAVAGTSAAVMETAQSVSGRILRLICVLIC